MRALLCLPLLLITSALAVAADAPRMPEFWDVSYLEREWGSRIYGGGLRLKDVHYTPATKKTPESYELLFVFDRDIPETFMSEFAAQFPPVPSQCSSIIFYIEDVDDVALGRGMFYLSAGELTGKAGDAFKVTVIFDKAAMDKMMEKRVAVPGTTELPPIYTWGRIRVRPVLGLPTVGPYRDSLSLRIRQ